MQKSTRVRGRVTYLERSVATGRRAERPRGRRARFRRQADYYAGVAGLGASGSSNGGRCSVAPFDRPRSSGRTIPSIAVTVPRRLALWRAGSRQPRCEPTTALACLAISTFSAITTSPKGPPGGAPPPGGQAIAPGSGQVRRATFGPSRRLAGPSGACSAAGRNARLRRRSTRLASRGGRRG